MVCITIHLVLLCRYFLNTSARNTMVYYGGEEGNSMHSCGETITVTAAKHQQPQWREIAPWQPHHKPKETRTTAALPAANANLQRKSDCTAMVSRLLEAPLHSTVRLEEL